MKTTKDLFIPYDLAIELDKVDFRTAFFGFYNNQHEIDFEIGVRGAPMWQQVFDWFIDNHKMSCVINRVKTTDDLVAYLGIVHYEENQIVQLNRTNTLEEAKYEIVSFMIFVVWLRQRHENVNN